MKARRKARQAASQVAPFAASARMTARQGVHSARAWTAPRLERSGQALQERVAPKMSAMLRGAARRIEPAQRRRRRWPFLTAGLVTAIGAAAAAVFMNRRGAIPFARLGKTSQTEPSTGTDQKAEAAAGADVNGRVRAS